MKKNKNKTVILRGAKDLLFTNRFFAKNRLRMTALFISVLFIFFPGCGKKDILSSRERKTVEKILKHWETWVPARKLEGTAPLMTFEELYQGLDAESKSFLNKLKNFKTGGRLDVSGVSFQKLTGQGYFKNARPVILEPQYLPPWTYESYRLMMVEMRRDLGKILLVESGYRSPAYQLYTFVFYLPKHHYSIAETRRWVALPGHSEHGNPDLQAIDFINEEGINGDNEGQTAETFEKLPEFDWLTKRGKEFGFVLSYPRGGKDTTYEPWHWRFARPKS